MLKAKFRRFMRWFLRNHLLQQTAFDFGRFPLRRKTYQRALYNGEEWAEDIRSEYESRRGIPTEEQWDAHMWQSYD